MNQPLHRIRQLHIEAPVGHTGNDTIKDLANALGHVLTLLEFDGLPLRFLRTPLRGRTLDGHAGQDLIVMSDAFLTQAATQIFLNNAVDLQIGITSDRRGEMGIILRSQAEMSAADGHIFCLLHGTQGQTADECFLFGSFNLFQQLLQLLRMHLTIMSADGISKVIDKHTQALHLLRVRVVVGTVHKRKLLPEVILRNGLIRHQHKILNDLGCRVAFIWFNIHRSPLLIQDDLRLRKVKIDGAALMPLFPQNVRQLFHKVEHLYKSRVLFHVFFIAICHNGIHRGVSHAAVYPDHGLRDLMPKHASLRINLHDTAECQTVCTLIQGTNAVGKLMRQHRDHTVYQIYAGAAV